MIIDMLRVHRDGGESSIIDMLLVHRDAPMSIDTLRVHRDGGESSSIELLEPAAGSLPGDRVYVEGLTDDSVSQTAPPLPPPLNPKKKIWDKLQVLYTATATVNYYNYWTASVNLPGRRTLRSANANRLVALASNPESN